MAHVVQALTEANPDGTVLSIDGVSAFDMVSRRAMLAVLRRVPGGDQILPFVRLFYGSQSRYFWEDDAALVHHILQGERGEQGDPLMSLLFSLGIHDVLHASQQGLGSEHLMAFHDDVYVVTLPHRVAHSFSVVQEQLRRHSNIRVHLGKIKVWNASGVPGACQILQRLLTPLETESQCGRVLDCPLSCRASKFWEHLLVTQTSLQPTWIEF